MRAGEVADLTELAATAEQIGGRPNHERSEWVQDFEKILPTFDRAVLEDIRDLIGSLIAQPKLSAQRQQRLGLLVRMVAADGTGEVIRTRAYQRERAKAATRGEDWPDASTLSLAFGGWLRAVKAAMDLAFRADSREADHNKHRNSYIGAYSYEECVQAVVKCAVSLGFWPTPDEYSDWSTLARRAHRAAGCGGDPRIPSLRPFRRKFGGFDTVKSDAMARVGAVGAR